MYVIGQINLKEKIRYLNGVENWMNDSNSLLLGHNGGSSRLCEAFEVLWKVITMLKTVKYIIML